MKALYVCHFNSPKAHLHVACTLYNCQFLRPVSVKKRCALPLSSVHNAAGEIFAKVPQVFAELIVSP